MTELELNTVEDYATYLFRKASQLSYIHKHHFVRNLFPSTAIKKAMTCPSEKMLIGTPLVVYRILNIPDLIDESEYRERIHVIIRDEEHMMC